jgi:hypothetical protein
MRERAGTPQARSFAVEGGWMDEVHELLITASRLPEHIADRSDLADDLEVVIQGAGGGEWLGGGCWFPLGPVDPNDPGTSGWEMEFAAIEPDRAVVAVIRRLAELGAAPDTVVRQSGPVRREHRVYPAGGQ